MPTDHRRLPPLPRSAFVCVGALPAPSSDIGLKNHTSECRGFSPHVSRPQVRRTRGITGAAAAPHVGITVMPR